MDAGECWAVGGISGALVEGFDGTAWTVVSDSNLGTLPGQSGGSLAAVGCTGPDSCWAVGSTGQPTTLTASLMQPLIVEYTGTYWTVASSPYVSGPNGAVVTGIACLSADDCWAVGAIQGGGWDLMGTPPPAPTTPPLVEHYDGVSWVLETGLQAGNGGLGLTSVTCLPSTGDCYAVGGSLFETLTGA